MARAHRRPFNKISSSIIRSTYIVTPIANAADYIGPGCGVLGENDILPYLSSNSDYVFSKIFANHGAYNACRGR